MTWQLDNVYERNKESPYTFYKPSKEVINSLEVGDLVKLIFFLESDEDGYRGERMWVEIIERKGNDFVGELENEPYRLKDLNSELLAYKEMLIDIKEMSETEFVSKYLNIISKLQYVLKTKNLQVKEK